MKVMKLKPGTFSLPAPLYCQTNIKHTFKYINIEIYYSILTANT
jgi:hypothetical protein